MDGYRCKNCGYSGQALIFQFNTFAYCVATNSEEPEYVGDQLPEWVETEGFGEAEIGEPVGCLNCHAWGLDNFELVNL